MGRIAQLLSWALNRNGDDRPPEAKGDPGGLATFTAEDFQPSGVDAQPLEGDYFATHEGPATGDEIVSGYLDTLTARKAGPGEYRVYARSGPGEVSAEIILRASGEIEISSIKSGSKITLNGVTIDQDGNISTPGDVEGAGVSLSTHTHGYIDSVGSAATPTPSETTKPDTPAVAP
jgi:hypothetical protein